MKKIFSFVAAALVSATMFAAPAKVPTEGELSANFDATSNVVLAVYFDEEVCNDLVFVGNYQGWNTSEFTDANKAQSLDGYEGWYIFTAPATVSQTDDAGNVEEVALQAKPVQLKKDGSFSWDFQTGDVDSWLHLGGLEANITPGYDGESNIEYGAAGVYIYESSYFKVHNSPCVDAVEHDYNITLYAPNCGGFKPAIIGAFNDWSAGMAMVADVDDEGNEVFVYTIHDEEGHEFKFKEVNDTDWTNQIQLVNEDGEWYDNPNIRLTEETEVTIHYEAGRYTLCTDAVENVAAEVVATKVIRNGEILIIKGDAVYNLLGAEVK